MKSYDHDQTVSSAAWTITHNLNTDAVAVDVFIDNGSLEKIMPASIEADDDNTITVTFSVAQTGKARVIG